MGSMVKVKVFYDGTYEVEEVNDNAATQHLYIAEKKEIWRSICVSKRICRKV